MKKILTCLIFISLEARALELFRVDKSLVEDYALKSKKIELIISDNCSHCLTQIRILKECVKDEDVVIFIDNKAKLNEVRLKGVLRKKNISYTTFEMNEDLKKRYDYKGITPMIHIHNKGESESYTGVIQCDYLKIKLQT